MTDESCGNCKFFRRVNYVVALFVFVAIAVARAQYADPPLAGDEVIQLVRGGRSTTTTGAIATLAGSAGGGGLGTPIAAAAAGSTQNTATAISANVTVFTTVSANQGTLLTRPYQIIINAGANSLSVYPNSGATITGGGSTLATNAAFSVAAGSSASFACTDTTHCYAGFSSFQ